MPHETAIVPPWAIPHDLETIVEEDGEWEDPSWDPILLGVIGDTRYEGRLIARVWQLSFWPAEPFFRAMNAAMRAKGETPDGPAWSAVIRAELAIATPALSGTLHDDSDAAACVVWVEAEADAKILAEAVWLYLHALKAAYEGMV